MRQMKLGKTCTINAAERCINSSDYGIFDSITVQLKIEDF
jgi:hypothetical protein